MRPRLLSDQRNERGIALVAVLWALLILSIVATIALGSSIAMRRAETSSLKRAEADASAEAAVARAFLALTDPRPDHRWRVDGVAETFVFASVEIKVTIEDELGKIDLNTGREDLLRTLFHSINIDPDLADALTDRVLDWRTPGNLKRLNGALPADYERAGLPYRPRGSAFQSVDELQLVLGMTPAIFARIEPAVTVYSKRPTIDPRVVSRQARVVPLGGTSQSEFGTLVATPQSGAIDGRASQGTQLGVLYPTTDLNGRAFRILIELDKGPHRYTRQVVIRLTGDPAQPYWILSWDNPATPVKVE